MQQYKKKDFIEPIIVWIIASILFHVLLMLGIITLRINSINLPELNKNQAQDHAILMMDEPKQAPKIPTQQATQPIQPKAQPEEPKQAQPKTNPLDFKLIPGRKGIDNQDLQDFTNLDSLPTPENQTKSTPKKVEPTNMPKHEPKKLEDETNQLDSTTIDQEKKTTPATQFIDQNGTPTAQPKKKSTPLTEQNPYEFVPKSTSTISFKDLKLGFNENSPTVGNTPHLLTQGSSLSSPDATALKHITYYSQCATMIQNAFATNPLHRLVAYQRGKRFSFRLQVNREGKNLHVQPVYSSGDPMFDRIVQESVQSIVLFPKVPKFIQDDPFTMNWTFFM